MRSGQRKGVRQAIAFALSLFAVEIAVADNSAIPGIYDAPGFLPIREYGLKDFDTIDPATGSLKLVHTDLVLPLNGEIDIQIIRAYHLHQRTDNNWYYNDQGDGRATVGANWDIHMGRLWPASNVITASNAMTCRDVLNDESGANRHVLELPDGTKQVLFKTSSSDTLNAFISNERWVARCLPTSQDSTGKGGLVVFSPEGMKYTFNQQGYAKRSSSTIQPYVVTRIEDRNGNAVVLTYENSDATLQPTLLLKSIDPMESGAPTVTFFYNDSAGKTSPNFNLDVQLDKIVAGDRTVKYEYGEATQPNGSSFGSSTVPRQYLLTKVTLPDSTDWVYTYHPSSSSTLYNSSPLASATTPLKGKHNYAYEVKGIPSLSPGNTNRIVVKTRQLESLGTWTYSYVFAGTFNAEDETTAAGPYDCIKYRHKVLSTALWDSGTLRNKKTYESNCTTQQQEETYTWSPVLISPDNQFSPRPNITSTDTYIPTLTQRVINRNQTNYTVSYADFDGYGNPRTITTNQQDKTAKVVTYTYDVKPSKWILRLADKETYAALGNITINRVFSTSGNLESETTFGKKIDYTYSGGEIATKKEWDVSSGTAVNSAYSNYVAGVPKNITRADGVTISRVVDNFGNITTETYNALVAPPGRAADTAVTTGYSYDKANRLTGITTGRTDDSNVTIAYVFSTQSTKATTRGSYKETEYLDKYGRNTQTKREDTGRGIILFEKSEFDAAGRVQFQYYPFYNGAAQVKSKRFYYDALGRLTQITHNPDEASPATVVYQHQANNKVKVSDEDSKETTYSYLSYEDPDSRVLTEIAAPEGQTTKIGRNVLGQITSVEQGGVLHSYFYDTRMLPDSEVRPETGTTEYGFDDRGNMTSKKVGSSGVTNYAYDGMNRLKTISYPAAGGTPNLSFYYDKFGKPWQISKGGSKWDYEYDANGNLKSEKLSLTAPAVKTYQLSYAYDGLDHLTSTTYPTGKAYGMTVDALGRTLNISSPTSSAMASVNPSSGYYASGMLKEYGYGNGRTTTVTEHSRKWPRRLTVSGAGIADFEYDYYASGDVKTITDYARTGRNRTLTYDGLHRLKTVTGNGSWGNASYNYDAAGNITTRSIGGTSYTLNYPSLNRIGSVTNTSTGATLWSYGYDVYGNVATKGNQSFIYDDASNLIKDSTSSTNNYLYDGHNRRYWSKDSQGNQTYSVYSLAGKLVYQEDVSKQRPQDYLYLGDQLIARVNYCDNTIDSDGDGIPNCHEISVGTNPDVNDANEDRDGDGLSNIQEYALIGTAINNPDSDGDGMPDGFEWFNGLNPTVHNPSNSDVDQDGISDYNEYLLGTLPTDNDTDNDGIPDGSDPLPKMNIPAFIPVLHLLLN